MADYLSLVKIEHTLFALPFAYGAMVLAAGGWPGWRVALLVTLAMVGARTAAMAANRVIDAAIDARNPRTKGREIPSGKLTRADGVLLIVIGLGLLVYAGASLNALTLMLLPIAVLFLVAYPYTKRFTWACHLWLGATIGAAAAGGWVAVTGSFALPAVLLWVGVGAWVAGFDVVYALLDRDFDLSEGINSIPSKFGVGGAKVATGLLYTFAVGALLLVWASYDPPGLASRLGWPYPLAVSTMTALLVWQMVVLARRGAPAALSAFNANLILSPLMLAGICFGIATAT
ncbi:MAG: putative 4-hydroxybenzoate polyprenyltransferase [Trueperaceae bacterium]|nr:putative 4-hydroxybenzoate polyprenyltransferase [Trueperaceae bacterium]